MSTFTTRSTIDELIANDGLIGERGPDNVLAIRIVEYDTPEGQTCWGVVFEGERHADRYDDETGYVRNPRVIFPVPGDGRVSAVQPLPPLGRELHDLPASVEYAIKMGLAEFADDGETEIPVGLEDASGDRYGLLTDDDAVERHLRVTRITIVVEPAEVAS